MELNPRTPGSRPELKAGAKLLSHPGVPHYDIIKHLDAFHSSPLLFSALASIPLQYKMADIVPYSHPSPILFESWKLQEVQEAAFSLYTSGKIKEENPAGSPLIPCYSNCGSQVTASSLTWELIKMQCPKAHPDY